MSERWPFQQRRGRKVEDEAKWSQRISTSEFFSPVCRLAYLSWELWIFLGKMEGLQGYFLATSTHSLCLFEFVSTHFSRGQPPSSETSCFKLFPRLESDFNLHVRHANFLECRGRNPIENSWRHLIHAYMYSTCMYVHICAYLYIYVYVCTYICISMYAYTYICISICIYIYIYICIDVCIYVCVYICM